MIEIDNDIIKNISKHKSWLLEFLTVDEIATIVLLTSNDIDNVRDKIRIVSDELDISEDEVDLYMGYG